MGINKSNVFVCAPPAGDSPSSVGAIQSNTRIKNMSNKSRLLIMALLSVLVLEQGCTSSNPNVGPMTHAAFTAAVTLGEQFALEQHPEATPYVRAAAPVVCAAANGTNVSPASIVEALNAAGVTNATAKIVINGGLALFNVVVVGLGTNQTEVRAYAMDLCTGMQNGLPAFDQVAEKKRARKAMPPHLK